MAINTYFKNIADAIRTKTGGSGLITPANMSDKILNIRTGVQWIVPLEKNLGGGFIGWNGDPALGTENANWFINTSEPLKNDVYYLDIDTSYLLCYGFNHDQYRLASFRKNPKEATNNMLGLLLNKTKTTYPYFGSVIRLTDPNFRYLTIYKTNNGSDIYETYLCKIEDLIEE